jgi:RNA-binding protein YhbY
MYRNQQESDKFENWSNGAYSRQQIDSWWLQIESLLTVGSKGVTKSQINSVIDLLSQHELVRIKLASDKIDPKIISKKFTEDEQLSAVGELIEVRKKGFMFRRKS